MCPETSALPSACGDALQSPLGSSPILRDLVPIRTIHSHQDASAQQRMRPDRLAIVLPVCQRVFFRPAVPIIISQSTSGRLFSWQHVLPNSILTRGSLLPIINVKFLQMVCGYMRRSPDPIDP